MKKQNIVYETAKNIFESLKLDIINDLHKTRCPNEQQIFEQSIISKIVEKLDRYTDYVINNHNNKMINDYFGHSSHNEDD